MAQSELLFLMLFSLPNCVSILFGFLMLLISIEETIQGFSRPFSTTSTTNERKLDELMQKESATAQLEEVGSERFLRQLVGVLIASQLVVLIQCGRPHPRLDIQAPRVVNLPHVSVRVHVHVIRDSVRIASAPEPCHLQLSLLECYSQKFFHLNREWYWFFGGLAVHIHGEQFPKETDRCDVLEECFTTAMLLRSRLQILDEVVVQWRGRRQFDSWPWLSPWYRPCSTVSGSWSRLCNTAIIIPDPHKGVRPISVERE